MDLGAKLGTVDLCAEPALQVGPFTFSLPFFLFLSSFLSHSLSCPTPPVGVLSKHQRVNLCYCASDPDDVLKDTRFILIRAECPYVQFVAAAHVISAEKFVVGVTNGRERDRSQVSDGKIEWVLRAWSLLSYV